MKGNSLQDFYGSTFLADTIEVVDEDVEEKVDQVRSLLEELA